MPKYFMIFSLLLLIAPSCVNKQVAPPRPTPIVTDSSYCMQAQVHLTELKCEVAKPTKKGLTFEQFCQETQAAGIFINPKCLSEVLTCDAVDDCTYSRSQK